MIQLSGLRITCNDSELPKRRVTCPEARGVFEKISFVAQQVLRCLAAAILSFVALVAVPFSYTFSYFRSSTELSTLVSQQRQAEVSAVSSSITTTALQELKLSTKAPSQEQLKSKVSQLVEGMQERSASEQLKKGIESAFFYGPWQGMVLYWIPKQVIFLSIKKYFYITTLLRWR